MPNSNKKSKGAGPPWFSGKGEATVLSELRLAWDVGASDREACFHAGISEAALYRYIEKHPELREEKEMRKDNMILKARMVVFGAIEKNDHETAKWYLEKKKKDEFSTRTENVNSNFDIKDAASFERLLIPIDNAQPNKNLTLEHTSGQVEKHKKPKQR